MSKEEFIAKPPSDDPVPLLIGLVGPSSSGKTFSALRMGTGIARVLGGDIHVIDTEADRARHYRNDVKFKHVRFGEPYSSARYAEAIKAQVQQGASVVIVDSMSHEHEGPGGYLELHEHELERLVARDKSDRPEWQKRHALNFLAWAKPAAERRALINAITSLNAVMIFCFRAKEKLIIRRGQDPIEAGWMPIGGEEFVFEMTVRALLPPNSNGVPDWKPTRAGEVTVPKRPKQFLKVLRDGDALCEEHGEALARWARGLGGTDVRSASRTSGSLRDAGGASADPPAQNSAPNDGGADAGPFDDPPSTNGPALLPLIGKTGREFKLSPDEWEKQLIGVFENRPFEYAKETWRSNEAMIVGAKASHPDHAARVEQAWLKRASQAASA